MPGMKGIFMKKEICVICNEREIIIEDYCYECFCETHTENDIDNLDKLLNCIESNKSNA